MLAVLKGDFVKDLLKTVSNDNKATVLGVCAGALVATKLDWPLLLKGDSAQIGTAVGAVVCALIGFYSNRPDAKKSNPQV